MANRISKSANEINLEVKRGIKKFVRYKEGAELYSIGLHTFQQLSKEAGAVYKVRGIALVNTEVFDDFLENFREPAEY
ncbi:MAG: DUF6462 family protein [Clostridium sp.]|nr:DUF6462 family protein [Clostridium sp.]